MHCFKTPNSLINFIYHSAEFLTAYDSEAFYADVKRLHKRLRLLHKFYHKTQN